MQPKPNVKADDGEAVKYEYLHILVRYKSMDYSYIIMNSYLYDICMIIIVF